MELSIQQEPGRIVVHRSLPGRTRVVLAVILGGFAFVIGRYLLDALLYFWREATAAEWRESIPGFLLVFAAFLLFAIPTWVMLFRLSSVIIDFPSRTVSTLIDDRVFWRQRHYRADAIDRIETAYQQLVSKGKASVTYPIRLVLKSGKRVTLTRGEQAQQTVWLRSQLASALNVPCVDENDWHEHMDD